jgi:hypothetical protein
MKHTDVSKVSISRPATFLVQLTVFAEIGKDRYEHLSKFDVLKNEMHPAALAVDVQYEIEAKYLSLASEMKRID